MSAVGAAVALAVGIRSYHRADAIDYWHTSGRTLFQTEIVERVQWNASIELRRGEIILIYESGGNVVRSLGSPWEVHDYSLRVRDSYIADLHPSRFAGFRVESGPGSDRLLIAPFWILLIVPLLPPVVLARRAIRSIRRSRARLCITCNYDLRATQERCPECGTVPAIPARGAVW